MGEFLEDVKTPVAPQDLLYAFASAWKQLTGEAPSKQSLCVILCQVFLESGIGVKSSHCYNFGNIKCTDKNMADFSYTYFKCNEIVPKNVGLQMVANAEKDGGKAYISSYRKDGQVVIWLEPRNKGCRFRAFKLAESGALAHLTFLKTRYAKCAGVWDSIVKGDPALFSHLLRQYKYYTADENIYSRGMLQIFNQMQKLEYDPAKIISPLSEDEKTQIINNVVLNMDDWVRTEMKIYDEEISAMGDE